MLALLAIVQPIGSKHIFFMKLFLLLTESSATLLARNVFLDTVLQGGDRLNLSFTCQCLQGAGKICALYEYQVDNYLLF